MDEQIQNYPRLDDLYNSVNWTLARCIEPEGIRISRSQQYYVLKTRDLHNVGIPTLRVVYTLDENQVVITEVDVIT